MITQLAPFTLQNASDSDYDFIYDVARTTMRDYVARIWGWDEEFQSNRFRELFITEDWQIILVDGAYAGCMNVVYRPSEIFLANIYVLPRYQRRGIGSSLIRRLQYEGSKSDRPVRLNVLTSNDDAYRLYVRLGFQIVESTPEKRLMST